MNALGKRLAEKEFIEKYGTFGLNILLLRRINMKNQYFGDINDYKKYSLLRLLSSYGQIETVVCWVLTHDDDGSDGNRTKYLKQPDIWRRYDPTLYEYLQKNVLRRGIRDVKILETSDILANCRFYSEIVDDDIKSREAYFNGFLEFAKGTDLVFFDPDNGLEVKSVPRGKRNSSKYLYWSEVKASFKAGHSILIYQHFPRMQRESFIRNLVQQFKAITEVGRIFYYKTRYVVFFLLTQPKHEGLFIESNANILNVWGKIMRIHELQLV